MMQGEFLEFERPIMELEAKIEELRRLGNDSELNVSEEIGHLERVRTERLKAIFSSLDAWQIVQLARHPQRPYFLDYVDKIFTEFDELHGDRQFADDEAVVGGLAYLEDRPVMLIGQQKGRGTKERVRRNFGMPKPEGYRKALRLMELAERFTIPVLTFIDTPGAYPGIDAEERNESAAIASNLQLMSQLRVPIVATVIGEGGSGGALAIGVADSLLMLEYSVYSVISPEGCASILWKSADKAPEAAAAMGMTAKPLLRLRLVDEVIEEPLGGAHRNPAEVMARLKTALIQQCDQLQRFPTDQLLERRYNKLLMH